MKSRHDEASTNGLCRRNSKRCTAVPGAVGYSFQLAWTLGFRWFMAQGFLGKWPGLKHDVERKK